MMNHTQANMQEKELLNDLLNQEKQIMTSFTTAAIEASSPEYRTMMLSQLDQVSQDQYNIFSEMSNRGYYQVKVAQPQDVNNAKQQAMQMQNTMH